jgi:hypothetical protein
MRILRFTAISYVIFEVLKKVIKVGEYHLEVNFD